MERKRRRTWSFWGEDSGQKKKEERTSSDYFEVSSEVLRSFINYEEAAEEHERSDGEQ